MPIIFKTFFHTTGRREGCDTTVFDNWYFIFIFWVSNTVI